MSAATSTRLTIGHDEMNAFAGLSDGDHFGAPDGTVYELRGGSYGWTLRVAGKALGATLAGFVNVPDYLSFVRLVNDAALNGLESLTTRLN